MSASTWSLVVFGAVIGLLFFMLLYLDVASSVKTTFSSEQFASLGKLIDAGAIEQSPTAMSFAAYAYAVTGAVAHNKLLLIPAGALLFFMQWPVLVIFLLWMVWGRMKYETLLSKLRVVDATRASAFRCARTFCVSSPGHGFGPALWQATDRRQKLRNFCGH